jgi:hypothetical protein
MVLVSCAFAGCGSSPAQITPGTELPPDHPQEIPSEGSSSDLTENPLPFQNTPEVTEVSSSPPVEKYVALAKRELATRLRVDVDRIVLRKTEEMLWLNAALGCPRPGVFYPSGRVPGFQIWLEVEGTEYIYNTDFNGTLILCPELNPHAPNADTDATPGVPIE